MNMKLVDVNTLPQIEGPKRHSIDDEINKVLNALPHDHKALALGQALYRCAAIHWEKRWRVARECMKYETPALGVVAQVNDMDYAAVLDRRLRQFEEKLIQASPAGGGGVDVRLPTKSIPDRRFRRI